MAEFKGSRTEQNLKRAFAGESQARNKYTYYATKARQEGYEQIAALFLETADNEREHAKMWFKYLNEGTIPETEQNLQDAANGEKYEWSDMYIKFAKDAEDEGFEEISNRFKMVAAIEKQHEKRFLKLLENLKEGFVFSADGDRIWKCRSCGHTVIDMDAPSVCPVCGRSKAFFEMSANNW